MSMLSIYQSYLYIKEYRKWQSPAWWSTLLNSALDKDRLIYEFEDSLVYRAAEPKLYREMLYLKEKRDRDKYTETQIDWEREIQRTKQKHRERKKENDKYLWREVMWDEQYMNILPGLFDQRLEIRSNYVIG